MRPGCRNPLEIAWRLFLQRYALSAVLAMTTWEVNARLLDLYVDWLSRRPRAAVAHVQAVATRSQTTSTTVAKTWTTTTGNAIVGCSAYTSAVGTDDILSISDGTNTFTKIATIGDATNSGAITTFYSQNITGGSKTVTITYNNSEVYNSVILHEVSGAATTGLLDNNKEALQASPGTGANGVTTGTVAVVANGYIFSAVWEVLNNSAAWTVGTGFVSPADTAGSISDVDVATEHLLQGAAGNRAGTWTTDLGTNPTMSAMVSLKPLAAAGGIPNKIININQAVMNAAGF